MATGWDDSGAVGGRCIPFSSPKVGCDVPNGAGRDIASLYPAPKWDVASQARVAGTSRPSFWPQSGMPCPGGSKLGHCIPVCNQKAGCRVPSEGGRDAISHFEPSFRDAASQTGRPGTLHPILGSQTGVQRPSPVSCSKPCPLPALSNAYPSSPTASRVASHPPNPSLRYGAAGDRMAFPYPHSVPRGAASSGRGRPSPLSTIFFGNLGCKSVSPSKMPWEVRTSPGEG